MSRGAVTISIDLELAWGNWDNLTSGHIAQIEHKERPIVKRLVELLDQFQLPVTWAFVAALLDPGSARGRPGGEHLWYAPDVIDRIRSASVHHDLGSHGGRHIYLDTVSDAEAEDDLGLAQSVHQREGLAWGSFVFPRNQVGRKPLLSRHGVRVYRGTDHAWHQRIRNRQRKLGRAANLVDKMLPIAPETVQPEADGAMINLPGSLLFFGREGVRRFAAPGVMQSKLRKGLEAARHDGGVFHLWFHPSNFWYDTETQAETFGAFAREVAESAGRGEIEVRPMAAFA
jgi:hypothetical protein